MWSFDFTNTFRKKKAISLPVCTLPPIWSSDIVTKFPFSSFILAIDGKQFLSDDGAGVVVAVLLVVTQIIKTVFIQFFPKLA